MIPIVLVFFFFVHISDGGTVVSINPVQQKGVGPFACLSSLASLIQVLQMAFTDRYQINDVTHFANLDFLFLFCSILFSLSLSLGVTAV